MTPQYYRLVVVENGLGYWGTVHVDNVQVYGVWLTNKAEVRELLAAFGAAHIMKHKTRLSGTTLQEILSLAP